MVMVLWRTTNTQAWGRSGQNRQAEAQERSRESTAITRLPSLSLVCAKSRVEEFVQAAELQNYILTDFDANQCTLGSEQWRSIDGSVLGFGRRMAVLPDLVGPASKANDSPERDRKLDLEDGGFVGSEERMRCSTVTA